MISMAYSQNNLETDSVNLAQAHSLLIKGSPHYDPIQAMQLYSQAAQQGNAKAMNAIGMMYSLGLGVAANNTTALMWFQKAADAGYANAWVNIGIAFKNEIGVKQDLNRAYLSFCKGAELNSPAGMYSQGYMLYKGFGCEQNYEKAVELFKKSLSGNLGSRYLLGLCFRNGYGITQNTDSARYWLQNAAAAGYKWAADELQAKEPENSTAINTVQRTNVNSKQSPTAYKKIKHDISKNSIEGSYTGYVIKYDWSGKNVIRKSKLTLVLSSKDSVITGTWVEDDTIKTEISALFQDTAVLFNNTEYSKQDHYNIKAPNRLRFKNASLQLVSITDSVYLAGNIHLYSNTYNEPEKPMYVILTKLPSKLSKVEKSDVFAKSKVNTPADLNIESDVINLLAYPNPFRNSCNIAFNLEKDGVVTIKLADLSGRVLYHKKEQFSKGKHTSVLNTSLSTGSYILYLSANNKMEQTILIKQ